MHQSRHYMLVASRLSSQKMTYEINFTAMGSCNLSRRCSIVHTLSLYCSKTCSIPEPQSACLQQHGCNAAISGTLPVDVVHGCQGKSGMVMQIEQKHCAFVTFTSRQAAETAAEALSNRLIIKGNRCRLLWGKPQQKRDENAAAAASMLPSQVCIAANTARALVSLSICLKPAQGHAV